MNTKQEVSAWVWVKASERLPEVPENASGLIIIREVENKDNYKTSWFSNLKGKKGSNSLLKRFPARYEWLDESQPESVQGEGLREALEKIAEEVKVTYYNYNDSHNIDKVKKIALTALSSPSGQEKDAVAFAEWIAKESYITTTLAHESEQLWQKCDYPKSQSEEDFGPEINTADLYTLYLNRRNEKLI